MESPFDEGGGIDQRTLANKPIFGVGFAFKDMVGGRGAEGLHQAIGNTLIERPRVIAIAVVSGAGIVQQANGLVESPGLLLQPKGPVDFACFQKAVPYGETLMIRVGVFLRLEVDHIPFQVGFDEKTHGQASAK